MTLRQCARGIGLLAILLIAVAGILDDPAVFFAGVSLVAGLLVCYARFLHHVHAASGSVVVQRSAGRSYVLKGATIRVVTSITLPVPPRMQVTAREVLPPALAVQDGTTSLEIPASPGPHSLSYRITPVVHGEVLFPGICLEFRDPFFETAIDLRCEPCSGPLLTVQPVGSMVSSSSGAGGTMEIEKISPLRGAGIRSLREYYTGDNIRNIDWKLSAKFGKLYIREYTGIVNIPLLIVIDLPWSGLPGSAGDLDRMVSSVVGVAERSVMTRRSVSLLFVSGPNVLEFLAGERDLQHCMSRIREWMHPVERTVHQYRTRDRSDLRLQVSALDARMQENSPFTAFYAGLKRRYLTVVASQKPTVFAGQLNRIFSGLVVEELFLFTLGTGDTTHIGQIIRQAAMLKIRVHLRTPAVGTDACEPSFWGRQGAETLEAFV